MSADVPVSSDAARAPLGRTLCLARPVTGRLVLGTLLGAGAILADIGLMGTAAWLISRAAQHPNEASLAVAIVAVQFFGLSRGLFRYGERLVGHDAALHLLAELRVRAYIRLERLAPVGLPAFRRGDLLARIVQDVDSLQDLVIRAVPPFGMAVVVGVLTVATMAWMLPAAGLILALALLLSVTVVPWLTGRLARRRESSFAEVRGDLVAAMVDLTEGAAELVAFGAARAQVETVRRADAELTAIAASSAGTAGIGLALTTALAGLASCGCLTVGIAAVVAGHLGATELAVITLVPLAAFELVVGLPTATQALERVRQAASRFFEVTDAPEPVPEPDVTLPQPVAPFNLDVRSVWAAYPTAGTPALRDVDLSLRPGRRVAVVGPSGAGKSTLAAVMLRFVPVHSGSVALNGTPVECLSSEGVRNVVGLVGQDAYIFGGTIAENLAVGRREASEREMYEVLDRVGLTGWLTELPRGLRTQVGRSGAHLSGGQRQRVAVARALLADFPILVLDEPGEHLDLAGADALTADLLRATAGRSVMLITHRLAGLEAVDEVLVMEAGTVIERGHHNALLDRGGRYADLWLEEMMTERTASAAHLYPRPDTDHPMAATFRGSPDDGSRTP